MKKRLDKEVQCEKCPWRVSTDPYEIPNGYSRDAHCNLKGTIATSTSFLGSGRAMACHESKLGEETYCIGWLFHQLGPGNNIPLRMTMMNYDLSQVKLIGKQHERFEDTIPRRRRKKKRS